MSERADTAYSPRFREEEHSPTAERIKNYNGFAGTLHTKDFFKHQKHFANRGARYSGMFTKAPSFLRLRSENRIANFGFLELT